VHQSMRCRGMRDVLPAEMRRFRRIEDAFRRVCQGWGYEEVRTPTIEYGVHAVVESSKPGTAALTRKTLHRAVNELIAVWEEVAGVRDALILTAHAADQHLEALSTIRTIGRVRVVDILALESLPPLREVRSGPWHGGEIDTSLMLHLAPDLVDVTRIPPLLPASAEKGARFYLAILETLVSQLREVG